MQKNNWTPLPAHPDTDAKREALLLLEQFKEWNRNGTSTGELKSAFINSEPLIESFYTSLSSEPSHKNTLDEKFLRIRKDCKSCHREFRD